MRYMLVEFSFLHTYTITFHICLIYIRRLAPAMGVCC